MSSETQRIATPAALDRWVSLQQSAKDACGSCKRFSQYKRVTHSQQTTANYE